MPTPQEILSKVQSTFPATDIKPVALPTSSPLVPTTAATATKVPSPTDVLQQIRAKSTMPSPFDIAKSMPQIGTPFTQAVSKQAADYTVKTVPKVVDVIKQQGVNIKDALTGKLSMTPADLLVGVKKVGKGIADMGASINEGVVRALKSSVVALGGEQVAKNLGNSAFGDIAKVATGRKNLVDFPGAAPASAGTKSIPTYQDIYKLAHTYATDNKATKDEAASFAGLAVLGTMFSDNPAVGPEREGFKLSAEAVKDLVKTTDEVSIKEILKRENPGLSPTQLEVLTPIFRDAKTAERVQKAVSVVEALKKPEGLKAGYLSRPAPTSPLTPQQIYEKVHGVVAEPAKALPQSAEEAAARYYQEVLQPKESAHSAVVIGADDMKDYFGKDYDLSRHPIYSKAANDLVLDAAKRSPTKEVRLVAGGTGSGKSEVISKGLSKNFDGVIYDSTLTNYEGARKLIDALKAEGKEPVIYPVIRDPKTAKLFTLIRESKGGHPVSDAAFARTHAKVPEVLRQLLKDGDVDIRLLDYRNFKKPIDYANLTPSVNPLAVLQQMRYNEADITRLTKDITHGTNIEKAGAVPLARNEKGPVPAGRGVGRDSKEGSAAAREGGRVLRSDAKGGEEIKRAFSPNVLKTISQEKLVGPIADVLRKEFPKLSDRVVEAVAKRLKDMKRTSDIEAMLQTLDRASQNIAERKGRPPRIVSVVDRSQPHAVADLLSPKEKDVYMQAITRNLDKREDAVLAQQEYDALWEAADQKIIDRYNELQLGREILGEQLDVHPGKKLMKYVSRATGRLPEVTGQKAMKAISGSGKKVVTSEFGRRGDQLVTELGFETPEAAQKGVEDYTAMRDQLKDLEQEMRELRPHARAAQQAQVLTKDVPVVLQKKAGELDALTTPEIVRASYKDISGFKGQTRDVYRNFKSVFGEHYADIKKAILDPFDKSKGEAIDTMVNAGKRLQTEVVDKLGIKRGSKLDEYVMDFGEGRISEEELRQVAGAEGSRKVREAAAWFRGEYNTFIDTLNETRAKIYPNDPTKLIQHRKDYFRHFQELSGDGIKDFLDVFHTPTGIDPTLAGTSEFTKPKTKFLSFAQERLGKDSERSAIGGYIDYVPAYAYAQHIDQHIGNFRYVRRKLAEVSPRPGTTEILDTGGKTVAVKQEGINNFLEYLDDYANLLSGKSNPADRYIQKIIPGGRKTIKVIGMMNNRIKANTILGNLSSAVAQIFNVPQGVASAKLYSLSGMKRTVASVFAENTPMEASNFIKERYHKSMRDQFDIDWAARPVKAGTQRAKRMAVWLTGALDEVGTKFIWNSHYQKGLAEGMADPIKYADDRTRALVAGRGVGEKPLLQESKIFNVFAPFSLEVGNTWSVLGDFVKEKDFGAVALFFVASYLMNAAANHVRGSNVVFDPINAALEGGAEAADEMHAGNPGRAALKFGGRMAGEVLSNVPLGQTFASVIPDQWVQNATAGLTGAPITKAELYGNGDPGRFGATILPVSGLADPLYRLLPPFGGAQVKKTKDAIAAMLSGEVRGANGKLSMKTPTDAVSVVQAVLFGKNATLDAQNAYSTRSDLFQRVYRQTASRTELGLEAESAWADIKKVKASSGGPAAAEKLKSYVTKNPALTDELVRIAGDEKKGLDGTDRLIGMLGVKNGERAKFVADTLLKMKDKNERVQYVQTLAKKGLLTGEVIDQLTHLIAQPKAQ